MAEMVIRLAESEPDASSGAGPEVGVAGVSLLLPVMVPKPLPPAVVQTIRATLQARGISLAGVRLTNRRDDVLIQAAIVAFLLLFLAWTFSLYEAHAKVHYVPVWLIAGVSYCCGILFTEVKERV